MSYKFSFADNEIYSANDVNAITKRLVTSGVEDSFENGVAYNVSRFNEAGKLLYTSGVVPENCLTLKVVAAEDGSILINPGMAFFDDGSVIEIEEGGEKLSYATGVKNYVYLKNDLINSNISYPYCGVTAPVGDCVILAEIDEKGTIVDKRTYARGKLPGYQSVGGNLLVFNENITLTNTTEYDTKSLSGSATFDVGENNFEYILTYVPYSRLNSLITYPCMGIYDISKKTYLTFYCGDKVNNSSTGEHMYYSKLYINEKSLYIKYAGVDNCEYITLELNSGKLTVTLNVKSKNIFEPGKQYTFPVKLILF